MSQNHHTAGALTEGNAHDVVLRMYLRSRSSTKPDPIVEETMDPTIATRRESSECRCREPIGYARGFPIYLGV